MSSLCTYRCLHEYIRCCVCAHAQDCDEAGGERTANRNRYRALAASLSCGDDMSDDDDAEFDVNYIVSAQNNSHVQQIRRDLVLIALYCCRGMSYFKDVLTE